MAYDDYQPDVVERRKRLSVLSPLKRVDRRVLIAALASIVFFGLLWYNKTITGTVFMVITGMVVVLILVMTSQQTELGILEVETCMRVLKKKMLEVYKNIDKNCDVKIENRWILYHWEGKPKSYEILWVEINLDDKSEKKFTTEVDCYTGNLIKTKEATYGWNATSPTNTVIERVYVPEGKFFDKEVSNK